MTSAFQLGLLVGIVVAGGQADRRGPGPPFVAGVLVFMAGLTIGGLAPSMLVLVLARGLQGLGAGAIPAVAYAAIGRSYPEALRPRVFAVLSTAWVVPGLIGPALSALVAASVGWRWVFLGLLPLVAASGALAWPSLRRLGPPPEPLVQRGRLPRAIGVAAGAGVVLAGLTSRSPLTGALLVAAGLAIGLVPLRGLLPPGTLTARPGLPVAVLSRALLTFAFFGADTYVPLAITSVRGQSTVVASIAVTAATLAWTAASWVQERKAADWPGRRLIRSGFLIVAAGIACRGGRPVPGRAGGGRGGRLGGGRLRHRPGLLAHLPDRARRGPERPGGGGQRLAPAGRDPRGGPRGRPRRGPGRGRGGGRLAAKGRHRRRLRPDRLRRPPGGDAGPPHPKPYDPCSRPTPAPDPA